MEVLKLFFARILQTQKRVKSICIPRKRHAETPKPRLFSVGPQQDPKMPRSKIHGLSCTLLTGRDTVDGFSKSGPIDVDISVFIGFQKHPWLAGFPNHQQYVSLVFVVALKI